MTYYWYSGALSENLPTATTVNSGTWSLSSNADGYASVDLTTGVITVTALPTHDLTVTLTCTVTANGLTESGTKEITILGTTIETPTISRSGNTITLATTTANADIYYTIDGNDPTSSSTLYDGPFDISHLHLPLTVKAIAIRNGNESGIVSDFYDMLACETPEITIDNAGNVTITCATEGATIRWIKGTNPADPDESTGTVGTSTTLNLFEYIKAVAYKDNYYNSSIASDQYVTTTVSGDYVVLDDREDHSWSYYSDVVLPKNMRSLSPADVKITYYGDGIMMTGSADYTASSTDYITSTHGDYKVGAKVNVVNGENQNTFIYFKTLERGDATDAVWTFSTDHSSAASRCPYKPIPNPFQVRPRYKDRDVDANDFTGWRGFQCWRLKSVSGGAVYSVASGGTALSTGAVVNAETEIYFAPNSEYGMEVELEAVWARAYVKKANQANENPVGTNNVGYERNFCVPTTGAGYTLYTGTGKRITNANHVPVTISCYYPYGTAPDNTANSISNTATSLTADTKFENISISMTTNTLTLANYDIIIGRGCGASTINILQGISGNAADLDYTMRIESGTINQLAFVRDGGTGSTYTVSGSVMVTAILGSDYDRANNNDNTKLTVSRDNTMFYDRAGAFSSEVNKDKKVFDCVIKSGKYQENYWNTDENTTGTTGTDGFNYVHSFYAGHNFNQTTNGHYPGARYVTIEGGELGNINGGRGTGSDGNNDNPDATTTQTDAWKIAFSLRIKYNAVINGCIFGGAANTSAWGSKRIVLTGGKVYSWIAGGANGTNTTAGDSRTRGASYIYVGGNAEVGGANAKMKNSVLGGQVFGAGRGFANQAASMDTTHVAVADNAKIMKKNGDASGNVYGGGSRGYAAKQSNIYILGGTVEGKVFGGSFNNNLAMPEANVTMTGGTVIDGVYGGSNSDGDVGNVVVKVEGGTVGTSSVDPATSETGHVFGSGYGSLTSVTGNVHVNIGAATSSHSDWPLIYGNVYGGGHAAPYTSTGHTFLVTGQNGKVVGNIYGSGKGSTAIVTGYTDVLIRGHINVQGSVFGGGQQAQVTGTTNVRIED